MHLSHAARWRWTLVTGLAGALAAPAWVACAQDANFEQLAAATQKSSDLPEGGVDLTDKVTVTVNGGLRSTARTDHSAAISIRNISQEDLKGPLVVVIDGTGIATLDVEKETGTLPTGQPYVEVLDKKGTLKAGNTLRTQRLSFRTDDALTLAQRQQFELKLRVVYLPEEARTAQSDDDDGNIPGKNYSEKDFDKIAMIQEKWTIPLLQRGNGQVYGTALAEDKNGDLVVKVYTEHGGVADQLPSEVDGIPVEIMGIGQPFHAGPAFDHVIYVDGKPVRAGSLDDEEDVPEGPVPDDGTPSASTPQASELPLPIVTDPTLRFPRPVPIGVSISNADRLFDIPPRALCYSGTLGCRCVDPLGTQYILTNNHVGAAFYNPTFATPLTLEGIIGERIVQTSTGDLLPIPCQLIPTDIIGTLADFETIVTTTQQIAADGLAPPHDMDASIIQAVPGTVGFDPYAGTYPKLKRTVLNRPRLGTKVQKAGRTTIYTNGQITGVNVAAIVTIGGGARVAYFIKQYEIANLAAFGHPFGGPGDSGSLIVAYDPGNEIDGQPVCLLFAGGPSGAVDATLANPLGPILARFNLQIDDGTGPYQAGVSGTSGGAVGPLDPPSYVK
jgi:hypothetical protein